MAVNATSSFTNNLVGGLEAAAFISVMILILFLLAIFIYPTTRKKFIANWKKRKERNKTWEY